MLRSDLCDYSNAYIDVKDIEAANTRNKKLTFKNNAQFRSRISKFNNRLEGNAEDLNIVMPMYKLLEHSGNIL